MTGLADTGRVIAGRYRLEAPIGRGAMGVVWRARDELLDRDVAVKEVQVAETLTEEERLNAYQRTLREAKTAARLSHPAVVSVFDVANDGGRPWIVMELVNARSLDAVLASAGPLPARSVAEIGRQLLSALSVAHGAGVLHRDVKPSNVLLSGDGRAVLTDFGIATFQGDPKLTATGMVMGSPGFTAPERIRGGDATPASDLWSLGATLYAAVEGRGPYDARGGAFTTMSAIINEDAPTAPSAGALAPVIGALLRRDPGDRPDAMTASRMIGDVLPLLVDRGGGYQPTALAEVSAGVAPPTTRQPGAEPAPDFSSWYSSARGDSGWSSYSPTPAPAPAVSPSRQAPSRQAPSRPAGGRPASGTRGYHGGQPPRRGGARWVLVLIVLALLGAAAGVITVVLVRHQGAASSPGSSTSSPPASSTLTGSATSGGNTAAAPADPLVSAINTRPAGFVPAADSVYKRTAADAGTAAGFRMAYPSGWAAPTVPPNSTSSTFFRKSVAVYTQVDLTAHTYPDDMVKEAQYIRDNEVNFHPGYQELALAAVRIRGAAGSYWEFTYTKNGVPQQVLDLLWVANTASGQQSYAMLFTAPQADWSQLEPVFAAEAQSFAPLS